MYVKYFEAKQTQKINSMKQIIMTILINTYWLIITKVAGISLVAYILSLNNKANVLEIYYIPVSVSSYLGTSSNHLISLGFNFPVYVKFLKYFNSLCKNPICKRIGAEPDKRKEIQFGELNYKWTFSVFYFNVWKCFTINNDE